MPIIRYIPPQTKIVDNRNDNGNYYIAICDVCGTQFYPLRMNAKYCTCNCSMIQHRKDIAAGKKTRAYNKKDKTPVSIPNPPEIVTKKKETRFKSVPAIYQYLKEKFDTRGDRDNIIESLKSLEIGESFNDYGKLVFTKISPRVYIMTRN